MIVSLACLFPKITDETDEQHSSNGSSGNTKLEPEIQSHASADFLCRQRLSSVTLHRLLPHIGGSLKHTCEHLVQLSSLVCLENYAFWWRDLISRVVSGSYCSVSYRQQEISI